MLLSCHGALAWGCGRGAWVMGRRCQAGLPARGRWLQQTCGRQQPSTVPPGRAHQWKQRLRQGADGGWAAWAACAAFTGFWTAMLHPTGRSGRGVQPPLQRWPRHRGHETAASTAAQQADLSQKVAARHPAQQCTGASQPGAKLRLPGQEQRLPAARKPASSNPAPAAVRWQRRLVGTHAPALCMCIPSRILGGCDRVQ